MCKCMSCQGNGGRCICPEDTKPKPHKHAALIKVWADCPETVFQFRGAGLQSNCWYPMQTPDWSHSEIRIKPEPKPDVVWYSDLTGLGTYCTSQTLRLRHNIKHTYDGETNKLKSVEIIK